MISRDLEKYDYLRTKSNTITLLILNKELNVKLS